MDRFFRQRRSDEDNLDLTPIILHQTQQIIKSENIKLLLSDKENVEFLTLCTMRKSRTDFHILDTEIDTTYIPSYPYKEPEKFLNFTLPDLSILDCIASLKALKIPSQKIENRSISMSPTEEEIYKPNCFEKGNAFCESRFETTEVSVVRSFADLIYDTSSSEGGEACEQVENKSNKIDNSAMFDDLLNEPTDESEVEEFGGSQSKNLAKEVVSNSNNTAFDDRIEDYKEIEKEKAIEDSGTNFSRLLEDSFKSEIAQEVSSFVILEKANDNLNEENQNNISKDNSFTYIRSTSSGITITQAIEEIARINANKSLKIQKEDENEIQIMQKEESNQIQVAEKENSEEIEIIEEILKNSNLQEEKLLPSTSQLQKAESQKKHLQFQVTDSDDEFFNIDTPEELEIVYDKNILKSNELQVKTLSKPHKNEVVPINNYQVARVDSNKNISAEKENSNVALNVPINDIDWDSDFHVETSPVDNPKYFKVDESPKAPAEKSTKSFETDWISCGQKSNEDKKNSQLVKKLSLFQGNNNKSSTFNGTSDKNISLNNANTTSSSDTDDKEKDDDFKVFKKPAIRAPSIFSLKRRIANNQSTCRDKLNGQSTSFNQERASSSGIENEKEEKKDTSFNSSFEQSPQIRKKTRKVRKQKCEFIDNEADVSSDEENTSEGTSGEDEDLDGFVSYTQDISDHADMRGHYLQSVKSPGRRAGAFLIKKSSRIEQNVYSPPMSQLNDTYLHVSCIFYFLNKENKN